MPTRGAPSNSELTKVGKRVTLAVNFGIIRGF